MGYIEGKRMNEMQLKLHVIKCNLLMVIDLVEVMHKHTRHPSDIAMLDLLLSCLQSALEAMEKCE